MADSVREKILQNILTTMQGISIANGYVNNVSLVERWQMDGNNLVAVPAIIIHGGSEDTDQPDTQLDHIRMSVLLDVRVRTEASATDIALDSMLQDIKKAMAADLTRGGYAVDTSYRRLAPYVPVNGPATAGIIIEYEIYYRHAFSDPTTAR